MFHNFIKNLKSRMEIGLPGEDIQFLMAPMARERIHEARSRNFDPKLSAVLILLYPAENSIKTVLMERPVYEGVHSGQIAFPGGRFEEEDGILLRTALREAYEEVGIDPNKVEVIGHLSDVYILPSNFLVTPYIGFTNEIPNFAADPTEVQTIVEVDLFELHNETIKGVKTITQSGGFKIKTPYYEIGGFTVWGATAMMISELNAVVKDVLTSS